jgi:hypothetical protein
MAGSAMPSFSTDHTACSVNRFIVQRPALTSQPETNEGRRSSTAAIKILYQTRRKARF